MCLNQSTCTQLDNASTSEALQVVLGHYMAELYTAGILHIGVVMVHYDDPEASCNCNIPMEPGRVRTSQEQ